MNLPIMVKSNQYIVSGFDILSLTFVLISSLTLLAGQLEDEVNWFMRPLERTIGVVPKTCF